MSIFVDSSVWINHFRGVQSPQVLYLRQVLSQPSASIVVGDGVVLEVVRGCPTDKIMRETIAVFRQLEVVDLGGLEAMLRAAMLYRALRNQGITISKLMDLLIASWCIHEDVALLHEDKDFRLFTEAGLREVYLLS